MTLKYGYFLPYLEKDVQAAILASSDRQRALNGASRHLLPPSPLIQ